MLVSVILPIRNEAPFIEQVLRAVLNQDYPPDLLEAIVVDGMSDDGTREIVRVLAAQDPRLRLLDNPRHITPAGLNLAIRAARGSVIVRVDGHGVLPPNYVRECVAFLTGARSASSSPPLSAGGEGRGEVASPSIALLAVGGAWDSVGRGCAGEAIAIAMSSRFGVGNSPYRTSDSSEGPVQTDTVPYWAVRREVFERIGLFREEMLCHEDYEFNYRLRSAGGTILLLPWLRAKYYVRATLGEAARQYWRYGIWKGRFLLSHPESLKARHLIPPLFVMGLAAGAVAALLGPVGRVGLGSLAGLYVCFLLVAAANLACSHRRRREASGVEASAGRAAMSQSRRSPLDRNIGVRPSSGAATSASSGVSELSSVLGGSEPAAPEDGRTPATGLPAFQHFSISAFRIAVFLPLALATLHLCWGSGVWVGLLRGKVAGQPPRLSK